MNHGSWNPRLESLLKEVNRVSVSLDEGHESETKWLEDQLKFLNKSIFTKIRVNSSVLFPCKQVWKIFALPVAFCQSWPLTTLNPQFCLAAQYLFFCTGQMRNQWWPLVHCPFVLHMWSIFLNFFQSFKSHCLLLGALWISGDLASLKRWDKIFEKTIPLAIAGCVEREMAGYWMPKNRHGQLLGLDQQFNGMGNPQANDFQGVYSHH